MQIYKSTELTNPEYQDLPEISGSALVQIHNDCPAAWRFGEPKDSPALADGIAAHACILEPELFEAEFVRDIDPADHPEALVTGKDIEAWLKARGIKGYSGKRKPDLIAMARDTGEAPQILDEIIAEHAVTNKGKTLVKASTFDMIQQMRRVVFADQDYKKAFLAGDFEVSLVDPETQRKCRIDCITAGEIWDYKTTTSAHPDAFAKQAHDAGYWLKMAYQHDIYQDAFGEPPRRVVLLAQSKKPPYIPQAYQLTEEQLEVGREQYQAAFRLMRRCMEQDVWPAYGGGVQELPTPGWIASRYKMQ